MNRRGFTIVELMIVIAIMGVIVGITGIFSSFGQGQGDLSEGSVLILDTLRRARGQTMSGREDDVWGVHFEFSQIVLYKGATYNASTPTNIVFTFPSTVQATSIALTGGGSEVLFSDELGNTLTDGTITLTNSVTGSSKSVLITPVGLIDAN